MPNELILILSLFVVYSGVLISYILFEEIGLICFTVIATITANIEVLILVRAFGFEQTLGNILFASTFLVTDILSEVSGKKSANKAVNIGIFTSVCFILISQSWFLYTPTASDIITPSIKIIFSNTPRLMATGFIVYAIAQRFDVWFYHVIWNFTKKLSGSEKPYLWLRNNGSTLVSQLINSVLFTFFAFYGVFEFDTLISIMVSSYIIFIFTSLLDTPFVYLARKWKNKARNPLKLEF